MSQAENLTREQIIDKVQKLIQRANDGRDASRELGTKYRHFVEYENGACFREMPVNKHNFRLRRTIMFEPFSVEVCDKYGNLSNATVGIKDGNLLQVGCQEFKIVDAVRALNALCGGTKSYWDMRKPDDRDDHLRYYASTKVYATRTGVMFQNNSVSWSDVDRIYQALLEVTGSTQPEGE